MQAYPTTAQQLALQLGDNCLILAQRLAEWCGHGPVLEQDIALTNISLDLLGQTRMYYALAIANDPAQRTEDDIAYFRDAHQFQNVQLVEHPNTDWAYTIARQFFFDTWHLLYCGRLVQSSDSQLAEIAEKALKEITYHARFSSEWILRLGDGTEESHQRIQTAINDLWTYTGELTTPTALDKAAAAEGIAPDLDGLKATYYHRIAEVLEQATLTVPTVTWMQKGGKEGRHTEHLGFILAEMQHLQRTYPGNTW
jgi:ring-1,2-phenylacetyl-CoA epoxidase subunit PaaC